MSEPPPGHSEHQAKKRRAFKLRLLVGILLGLVLGIGVYALKKTAEVKMLQAAVTNAQMICPADWYPGDAGSCGSEGPACGHAVWSAARKCRVPELSTGSGCNICYEGQVTPCRVDDYTKPCSGLPPTCGVRYCVLDAGVYDYEDLCRSVGP